MRKLLILLLVVPLLLASGCMDYEEYLILNKDGSGSLKIHYSIDKAYLEQMQQMAVQMGGEKQSLSDMAAEMSPFDSMGEMSGSGVEINYIKSLETDEAFIWDMKLSFDDFAAYNSLSSSMSDDESETEGAPESEMSFVKQDNGTWLFNRSLDLEQDDDGSGVDDQGYSSDGYDYGDDDSYADDTPPESFPSEETSVEDAAAALGQFGDAMKGLSESMQKMAESASKHKFQFTVQFPGSVIESNATKVDGNTATWEYPIDKIMSAPPTLNATIKD